MWSSKEGVITWDEDEEEALATLVFDLLSIRGIDEEHNKWLKEFYRSKAVGGLMNQEQVVTICSIITSYENDYQINIPALPFRYINRAAWNNPNDLPYELWKRQQHALRARIWKEVWKRYPKLHQWGEFATFPGDYLFDQAEADRQRPVYNAEEQLEIEARFQEEVKKNKEKFDCSWFEAHVITSDYMERAVDEFGNPLVEKLFTYEELQKDLSPSEKARKMFREEGQDD